MNKTVELRLAAIEARLADDEALLADIEARLSALENPIVANSGGGPGSEDQGGGG
jgi:hypothetical protein